MRRATKACSRRQCEVFDNLCSAGDPANMRFIVLVMMFLVAMNVAGALSGCKELLAEDSRFAGCQELSTGESAVMWAANGSDAINIKYIMTDGADMGWMGLGLNVHGSMKGEIFNAVPAACCRTMHKV